MPLDLLMTVSPKNFLIRLILLLLAVTSLMGCTALSPAADWSEADRDDYQGRLTRGGEYLQKRQHSRALAEFTGAERLRPGEAKPVLGRAKALFYLNRFAETLAACAELAGQSADDFEALGFCWGARLEIGGAAPATKKIVRNEIAGLLEQPSPALELLYSAYQGYYYLQDREESLVLILRLAEKGADSAWAGNIAASLFAELVAADPGSDRRIKLAESYIRNFPQARMADRAATVVLQDLLKNQPGNQDYRQIARTVLEGKKTSPFINGAVALWLIEHEAGYDQVIGLLQKNLQGLAARRLVVPDHFSQSLWQQEISRERHFYNYLLGRAWLAKGKPAKAEEIFVAVIAAQPDWAEPYHFLGLIALGKGRAEQAIQYFRTALAKGSGRPETSRELRVLLADQYGFTGEPLAYFQAHHPEVKFRDVTEMVGLGGVRAERVAWGDYDNDGDDDLLLDGRHLFNNRNGNFGVVADQVMPNDLPDANGGVWGDYDNDHWLDIFVTSQQGNYLLHNEAGLRFTRTDVLLLPGNRGAGTEAAAWGDLNNDGYLDLYVANYEQGTVMRGQCGQDQLLVNQNGTGFQESGATAGVISEEAMCGRGVIWSDLNGDGWQDILVSNYRLDPNFLWLNQGNGSLVDVAETAGVQGHEVDGAYGHSIGSVSGDLDGDGDFDLFTSNLAHPRHIDISDQSMVLINNGESFPKFVDHFSGSGLAFDETSADPLLFDVDNDGDLDLYITSVYRTRPAHLYINDGKGRFVDQTWLSGSGVTNGWGAASADYDGDGRLDLLVASPEGVRLLHNEGGCQNWLAIRVDDHNCNRYGVGGKVLITYGGQSQVREIAAGRGSGSQDALTVHFGLGGYSGPVSVTVKSLCGETMSRRIEGLNRLVTVNNPGQE
jgi:Tfp pilus assembly protein PilF